MWVESDRFFRGLQCSPVIDLVFSITIPLHAWQYKAENNRMMMMMVMIMIIIIIIIIIISLSHGGVGNHQSIFALTTMLYS